MSTNQEQALRLAFGVVAVGLALAISPASAERISRVVNSDTVVTARGETVRLTGFDTPKIRSKCPRERELARQAMALLRRLVGSGLDLDRQGKDRYRRTLAMAKTSAVEDVAATLIRAGLAHLYEGRGPRGGWCMPGR